MSHTKSSFFKTLQWRVECMAYSGLELMVGILPGPAVFRFGESLGSLLWHIMPKRRKTVLRNLRIVFAGKKSLPEIQKIAKESFRRSGANLISAAYTARLTTEELRKVIDIKNRELLEEKLKDGKGVVLLLSHMGNWELLSRLVHLFPESTKTGAFYRPLNNELLDDRVLARREADGTRMFSKRDPFHQVAGFLREGGVVGILADQRVGLSGNVVSFFGRLTHSSPLPSLLARRTKSDVLALSLTTKESGRWQAVFHEVDRPYTTQHCMSALENAMKASPIDVFWLQERWRVILPKDRTIETWLENFKSQISEVPHRALLWLIDAPKDWSFPEKLLHPEITYEAVLAEGQKTPEGLPEATQVHVIRPEKSERKLQKILQEIDEANQLPLDLILTFQVDPVLVSAGRLELIPVISAL